MTRTLAFYPQVAYVCDMQTGRRLHGPAVKDFRKKAGMSGAELARLVGVGRSVLHNYETGYRQPKDDTARALAEALGVSYDAITYPPEPTKDAAA